MSELFDIPSEPIAEPPQEEDKIKLVRLITGEDILCVLREDLENTTREPTEVIVLSTPLKLIMHRTAPLRPASPMAIGIAQWLPDELLECHAVTVKVGHIVTVMEPKTELKNYYRKMVDIIHANMMQGDKTIREDITKAFKDAAQAHVEATTPSTSKTPPEPLGVVETMKQARMQDLLERLNEIDDYLMHHGEEDGPITYH